MHTHFATVHDSFCIFVHVKIKLFLFLLKKVYYFLSY